MKLNLESILWTILIIFILLFSLLFIAYSDMVNRYNELYKYYEIVEEDNSHLIDMLKECINK